MRAIRGIPQVVCTTLFALLSYTTARGSVLFSDGFTYPTGALSGNTNNDGESWSAFGGSPTVVSPGLSYPGVASSGNELELQGANGDGAALSLPSTAGGTGGASDVWLSFLFDSSASSATGFAVVGLGSSSGDSVGVGMLDNTGHYGIDDNLESPVMRANTSTPVNTTLTYVVCDFNFSSAMEYIWIDPATGVNLTDTSAAASVTMLSGIQTSGFDSIAVNSGQTSADYNVDEIRLGTTYADVSPVPEPGAVALALAGGAGILIVRRRRK